MSVGVSQVVQRLWVKWSKRQGPLYPGSAKAFRTRRDIARDGPWQRVFFIVMFASGGPAWGVEVLNLYQTSVNVKEQTAASRRGAAQNALAEILVRVSGSSSILTDDNIRAALRKPESYLVQFSYEAIDRSTSSAVTSKTGKRLDMQFDANGILRLLRDAQLPIWGDNRPQVLVWWGTQSGTTRSILGQERGQWQMSAWTDQGRRRGLPIVFPLMDLQDSGRVSTTQIWGFLSDAIEDASQRYGVDAIVVGRSGPVLQSGGWQSSWQLISEGQSKWFETRGDTERELYSRIVDQVSELLASRYAVTIREQAKADLIVRVYDIDSLQDYAGIVNYFEQLNAVHKAFLRKATEASLEFSLELAGDRLQLERALELDDKMLLISGLPTIEGEVTVMEYRWKHSTARHE